ncbi:MAG TPA: hypothetical protein GX692_09735 [Acholeplasmataceae bacterium]|nr:hypothetical protein [Acholeplasmataceae bacterium]
MKRPRILQNIINYIRFKAFVLYPEATISFEYKRRIGYKPDLKNPKTYNEKLQWLKLYWYDPKATICADKYLIREYVESKGLKHILNELYGVYDNVEQIDFQKLPEKFVMKVTHGCGQNLICKDKSKINWKKEKRKFKIWLRTNHYYNSLEWVYKDIKPRIIVEKLIETQDNKPPKDYKFFCFNGEPKYIFVASDRGENTTKFDFYDLEWNHLAVKNHYPNSNEAIPKPLKLQDMIEHSKVLSKGFPHVRVDFYMEKEKVIFGELTFFHFSGSEPFEPIDFDYKMGEYLELPNKN